MGRCVCSSCICVQPALWHADNAAYVFEVAVVALSLAGVHVEAAGHPRRPEPPNVATHGGSSKLESYQGPSSTIGDWGSLGYAYGIARGIQIEFSACWDRHLPKHFSRVIGGIGCQRLSPGHLMAEHFV